MNKESESESDTPSINSSNKPGDRQKELSDELNDFYRQFYTQDFRTELAQIRSELQGKVVHDVEDFDFEIDANIAEGTFLKLNTRKAIVPDSISGRLEIVRFSAFCCILSVFHVVSERKPCTLYLENLCKLSCSKRNEILLV